MLASLRPHHIARLIEYQDDLDFLVHAMAVAQYDAETVDAVRNTFQTLYNNPQHIVVVLGDGEAAEDSLCKKCVFFEEDDCFRGHGTSEKGRKLDEDARKSYGLIHSVYSVEELLERRHWVG